MTKKNYVKPIAIDIKTDGRRYMAGGGGYVSNKSIISYKIYDREEIKNILNEKVVSK